MWSGLKCNNIRISNEDLIVYTFVIIIIVNITLNDVKTVCKQKTGDERI